MKRELNSNQVEELLKTLQKRFEKNMNRHPNSKWDYIENKLLSNPIKLWSLNQMEETGGEPDSMELEAFSNGNKDELCFCDFATESPKGRRSLCYDIAALESRKEFKPKHSALGMAVEMGIEILNASQYNALQTLGNFDSKTSSWLKTPDSIRALGGAIFGDRRFGQVFIYHNGAESYYGVRGFRGYLIV